LSTSCTQILNAYPKANLDLSDLVHGQAKEGISAIRGYIITRVLNKCCKKDQISLAVGQPFQEAVLKDEARSTAALASGQNDESDPQDPRIEDTMYSVYIHTHTHTHLPQL
jgi:hypothetical protein